MRSILRAVLIWLMALAMPVQGLAAAKMIFCGPGHHPPAVSSVADHHQAAMSTAQDHQAAAHEHAVTDAVATIHGDVPHHWPDDSPPKVGKTGCSACASCCSMLAIPSLLAVPGEPDLLNAVPHTRTDGRSFFVAGNLKRPP